MKTASIVDLKNNTSGVVRLAEETPVTITREGKPVAGIVPLAIYRCVTGAEQDHTPKLEASHGKEQA